LAVSAPRRKPAHHFEDLGQQHEAATLGMWAFLATELMVFGGLFTGYTVYRVAYPEAFEAGSQKLNVWYGGVNTLVLLTSSLTMAMAVWAVQVGRRELLTAFLAATVALGAAFLVIKGFEYYSDYQDGLMPFIPGNFRDDVWHPRREKEPAEEKGGLNDNDAIVGPETKQAVEGRDPNLDPGRGRFPIETYVPFSDRVRLFFALYYIMTGLHALHLIIGITWLSVLAFLSRRGLFDTEYNYPVEVAGLYWHFVDVIWIFLLPLLYLVGTVHWHH
jgi:cytochrome c oxidase subunit 3